MHLERERLRTVGTRLLHFPPWKLTYAQNAAINVALHVVATAWVARRARADTSVLPWAVALVEVAGMQLLDLEALYPAAALRPYKLAHVGVVAALTLLL